MSTYDPITQYILGQTRVPQAFTQGLANFGFRGVPFGGVEANFSAMEQFQALMKRMLDQQLGSFHVGNNINALPFNMQSMFSGAAPLLTDPMYSPLEAPGFLSNGWQMGPWNSSPSWWHRAFSEQANGYPNFPAPNATSAFGSPSGYNQQAQQNLGPPVIGSTNPADYQGSNAPSAGPGGRNITASQAAADIGQHSATDASGNTYTINKSYGSMTDQEKDDANRFAHNMTG